jgi:hypothetical protein
MADTCRMILVYIKHGYKSAARGREEGAPVPGRHNFDGRKGQPHIIISRQKFIGKRTCETTCLAGTVGASVAQ